MHDRLLLAFALVFIPVSAQVTLDLTAHDKKGNAVLDLEPAEVQIVDGGAPVKLSSLELAKPGPASITIVFDQVVAGVAKTDQGLAEEFVTAASGHGYVFTVLKVEGRLHLVQPPTADIEAVKQAIAAATVANRPDYIRVTEAAEKQITAEMESASGDRQATAKRLMAMLMDSQNAARDPQSTVVGSRAAGSLARPAGCAGAEGNPLFLAGARLAFEQPGDPSRYYAGGQPRAREYPFVRRGHRRRAGRQRSGDHSGAGDFAGHGQHPQWLAFAGAQCDAVRGRAGHGSGRPTSTPAACSPAKALSTVRGRWPASRPARVECTSRP